MGVDSSNLYSQEAAALVTAELRGGERTVWIGQPLVGRFARRGILVSLFAIPFTAFAVFWIAGAAAGTAHLPTHGNHNGFLQLFRFFPLFGSPFLLVGIGMLSAPYWDAAQGPANGLRDHQPARHRL